MITGFKNSLLTNVIMPLTDAPSTLRTPISFMRWRIMMEAIPNKPMQESMMAIMAATEKRFAMMRSSLYMRSTFSFTYEPLNSAPGSIAAYTFLIISIVAIGLFVFTFTHA